MPEVVLVRHGSADSLYGDIAKRRVGLEAVLTRHRRRWLAEPARYARWCAELGRLHALLGDLEASRRWLAIAVRTSPVQYRGLGMWMAGHVDRRLLRRLARSRYAVLNP